MATKFLTPQTTYKDIATITSPVKIEPNGSGGVVITGVDGDVNIQSSDVETKTAKSITIDSKGLITDSDGNTIGGEADLDICSQRRRRRSPTRWQKSRPR